MTPVTVVCLKTGTKFTDDYVVKLKNMVERNLTVPHQFICFTDRSVDGITCHAPLTNLPKWWGKMMFFRPEIQEYTGKDPYLYLDLDVTIVNNIDQMVESKAPFRIIQQWKKIRSRGTVPMYNSSCMYFHQAGVRKRIWKRFVEARGDVMKLFRGDQDWIAYCSPQEATFPCDWFTDVIGAINNKVTRRTKIILNNGDSMMNHLVEDRCDYVKRYWI
jgi:hypothetical protein